MAREIWLRKNYRPFMALAVLPAISLVVAAALLAFAPSSLVFWFSVFLIVFSLAFLAWIVRQARGPRLSYHDGFLEVYLAGRDPIRVPVHIVECFFLGQGPSLLPRIDQDAGSPETATLIVRLAEAAVDWKHRDVLPRLGQWCEGYITIRGTYSEPLRPELALQLNRRLVEAHRSRK